MDRYECRKSKGVLRITDSAGKPLAGDWNKDVTLLTDGNGFCKLHGFRGDYELEADGLKQAYQLKKEPEEQTIRFGA